MADNLPSKISPSVEQRAWPYQMDEGIPQDCTTGAAADGRRWVASWALPQPRAWPQRQRSPPTAAAEPSVAPVTPQSTGSCTADERYAGLWEIPLQPVADASQQPIAAMDPTGPAFENFKRDLEWRMGGNRAPLGMLFHAGGWVVCAGALEGEGLPRR